LTVIWVSLAARPVIPVSLATVQFSRSAKRRDTLHGGLELVQRAAGSAPVSQNSTACSQLAIACDGGWPARPGRRSSGRSRSLSNHRGAPGARAAIVRATGALG